MQLKRREDYEIEDFLTDQSFINFHFKTDEQDELSWSQWLELYPHKSTLVNEARAQIDSLSLSISEEEYNAELENIKKAITREDIDAVPLFPESQYESKKLWRRKALQFAAVALAFVVGTGILLYTKHTPSSVYTETVNHHSVPLTIVLSDSTVVTLAPQSALKYPSQFQADLRDVYLTGDAQFHVKRNEKARFRVFSENIVATVLGTVFNFKKSGDSAIVIELLKGKLNVQLADNTDSSNSVLLYPNQKVTYSKEGHAFNKGMIELRATVVFQRSTFGEVAEKMKNAFGLIVINNSNKMDWRFTGEFENATAKDVIDNICFIKNLSATIKGDSVFIK